MSRADKQPAKRKLRWFQFSLRRLLVVMLLVGCGLGWLIHDVREQQAVVKMIKELNGSVAFGEADFLGRWDIVRSLFGEHAFTPVKHVWLGPGTTNAQLVQLRRLKKLETLAIVQTQVTDLSPLAGLGKLKEIYLRTDQEVRIPESLEKVVQRF